MGIFWEIYFDSPDKCIFENESKCLEWMDNRFAIFRIGYSIHVKDKINGMIFATRQDFKDGIAPIKVKSRGRLISAASYWLNNHIY
jgi:hypothetical protein